MNTYDVIASALNANKQYMDVTANNIANIDTTRTAEGGPYKRQSVIFKTMGGFDEFFNKPIGGGVEVQQIVQDKNFKLVSDPTNPDADANGMVKVPNINLAGEMTNLMVAQRAYESNVTSMNALKKVTDKMLEIGKS